MTGAIRPPTGLPAEQKPPADGGIIPPAVLPASENLQWAEETPVCGNKKRGSRSVAPGDPPETGRQTKKGGSRSVTLDGNPDVECGGVLLSHTLSSAVPSPRPGLSFRVRKGTGRLTWAMTTAKPIQRPTPTGRPAEPEPCHDSDRGGPGTGQRTRAKTLHRYRHRDHKKQRSLPSNERNHHRTRPDPASGSESVPRSPVSTGRLHPSRGFHLRPIEHVFNMRATGAPGSVKES